MRLKLMYCKYYGVQDVSKVDRLFQNDYNGDTVAMWLTR